MENEETITKKIIVFEIRPKDYQNFPNYQITEDFIKSIKFVPLYGGHVNPHLNFEIGIDFPEAIELISKKIRILEFNQIGEIIKEEERE